MGIMDRDANAKGRDYAAMFSARAFRRLLEEEDYSFIRTRAQRYGVERMESTATYSSFVSQAYSYLTREYRCEYVVKNALLSWIVKNHKRNTLLINEFRVGYSIVDIAMLNGSSTAFEIKTELDTPERLLGQLHTYMRLFDHCYVVVPEGRIDQYNALLPSSVGLLAYGVGMRGGFTFGKVRAADFLPAIDSQLLMVSLRQNEIKELIRRYYGSVPVVSSFRLFQTCAELLSRIPANELKVLWCQVVKERKLNAEWIHDAAFPLRQIMLSGHFSPDESEHLRRLLDCVM